MKKRIYIACTLPCLLLASALLFCGALAAEAPAEETPCAHENVTETVTKEPTCLAPGEMTVTCALCGAETRETIPPLGHNEVLTAETPATCTEEGEAEYTCARCGVTRYETLPATGHRYEQTGETPAACTEPGEKTYTCALCGDVYTEEIRPTGHNYKAGEETAPTCTEPGQTVFTCARCGDSFVYLTPAAGHDYRVTGTTPATCTTAGKTSYACTRCGDSYENEISAPGHDYRVTETDPGSCTEPSRTTYVCSRCGDTYLETSDMPGHAYEPTETVPATWRAALRAAVGLDPFNTEPELPDPSSLDRGYTFIDYTATGDMLAEKDGITYVVSDYGYTLIANKSYALPAGYDPGGLTAECSAAFYELQQAAAAQGLGLFVLSGYRSYDTQAALYSRYCARDGRAAADTYSARPGHSEHQTGLAMDVNSVQGVFAYTAEGRWLAANAHKYGFVIRYQKSKEPVTGYIYEPWHIRYLGRELAADLYASGLCLEEFFGITSVYQ